MIGCDMDSELEGHRLTEFFPVYDTIKKQYVLTPYTFADTFVLVPLSARRLPTGHLLMVRAFIVYYDELGDTNSATCHGDSPDTRHENVHTEDVNTEGTMQKAKTKQEELLEKKKKDKEDKKKKGKHVNLIK